MPQKRKLSENLNYHQMPCRRTYQKTFALFRIRILMRLLFTFEPNTICQKIAFTAKNKKERYEMFSKTYYFYLIDRFPTSGLLYWKTLHS
jgi:hypothetical protein